jgi:hypothetical protein
MAPVRLIQAPPVREAGMPFDVAMGLLLTALAWGCAAYLGVRAFDPDNDLQTTVMLLAMISAYQTAAFAVAARARKRAA